MMLILKLVNELERDALPAASTSYPIFNMVLLTM